MAQSNLPTSRRFKFEDYKDAPEWFANFLGSLNLFVDPVYQILNGGVTYQNLTIPQLYTTTVTAPAAGSTTFNFTNPLAIVPSSVILGNIYQTGNPATHPSSATCVYWHFSQGTVYIDNIPHLTPATSYVVTLSVS